MTAKQAIEASINTNSIVHLADPDPSVFFDISLAAEDFAESLDRPSVVEFWGENDAGNPWRIHVTLSGTEYPQR